MPVEQPPLKGLVKLLAGVLIALALGVVGTYFFKPEPAQSVSAAPAAPVVAQQLTPIEKPVRATAPVYEVGDFADRVFYRGGGSAEWGTLCKLKTGWVSVQHVTENGTPVIGPTAQVTADNEASDWSFVGVDPLALNPDDFGQLTIGESATIYGYPARDRDGEIIPAKVYLDDPNPPYMWLELHDAVDGIDAEGVVGGISGSCVIDGEGRLAGMVHANGFSKIEGTTNTWAKVVPLRAAILEAQGKLDLTTATALLEIDPAIVPKIEQGKYGLLSE